VTCSAFLVKRPQRDRYVFEDIMYVANGLEREDFGTSLGSAPGLANQDNCAALDYGRCPSRHDRNP
jgi:hypothetical protein